MYAPFFGLSREPFSIAPDPRFLFMSERHREALAHLLYGVRGGGGFVLLTGEIGAGKTTVGRCFLEQLPANCVVAYIFNPRLSVIELLQTVCGEFGVELPPPASSIKTYVDVLNRFLLQAHAAGRQALLIIDEAQSLSVDVLEQLRLLTNLETAERKLLQIILIGQPELRGMLAQPGLEQLAQRVIARYHLGPLAPGETQQYIAHRMAVAGPNTAVPFDAAALAAIHRLTGGVPRRINLLADRALLGAYAQGQHRVNKRTVVQAASEVFDRRAPGGGRPRRPLLAVAGLLTAVVLGSAVALSGLLRGTDPAAAPASAAAAAGLLPTVGASGASVSSGAVVAAAPAASAAPLPPGDGPPPPPGAAPSTDLAALLAAAHADEATAWRELALRWNVAIGAGDACEVAAQARLACYRSAVGGLPALRQLARPAVLALRTGDGRRVHAVLVGLGDQQATLQVGQQRYVLPLAQLAAAWRGEVATFWRTPPGWRDGGEAAADPALREWIEQQLGDAAPRSGGLPLRERVATFQVVQGLPADGRVGPLTLMQLNRVAGVDEPQLEAAAAR